MADVWVKTALYRGWGGRVRRVLLQSFGTNCASSGHDLCNESARRAENEKVGEMRRKRW